ncbi:PRC-barrel domain-containing protein [Roseomonas rosea]|uniref:PRC-barrel domain-containing protein n=1 Tax=Muricoccus roseus TaxID=198092 RepID=A0A1M6GZT0_9PROT|nr:PRC-barrel domain-containing protein [Roseomonas rosea]SHJ15438.1 PRC-barrel domain-containing protein [Roseomonas rosea]
MRCLPPCRARHLTFRLALAMSGLAVPALAQDTPPPAAQPAARSPAAREELPREASQRVIGREVTGPSGDVVGRIVNVLLDDNGQPRAAVLDYGGFLGVGRRRVAVAWRTLRFSPEIVRLELTRDQMRAFPDYKDGEPVVVAAPPVPEAAPEPVPAGPEPAAPGTPQPPTPPGADPARSN